MNSAAIVSARWLVTQTGQEQYCLNITNYTYRGDISVLTPPESYLLLQVQDYPSIPGALPYNFLFHHRNNNNNNNNNKVNILWNQQAQSNRTIPNNKPDIVIRDNEKGTCMLIDVAIPGDRNVIQKEAEKVLKYKDLTTEIQRMWNVKTRVIPVILGVTGTI
jgi:hypothetical protein